MKRYVYHNSQELSDIIKDIKLGNESTYVIYNAEGRRLKYDFINNSALLLVTDNQIPDNNPFYKESVPVEDVVVKEEEVSIDDAEDEAPAVVDSSEPAAPEQEDVDEESSDEEEISEEEIVEEDEPELAKGDEVQLPDGTDLVIDKVAEDEVIAHEVGKPDPEIPEELDADLDTIEEVDKSELDCLREENDRLKGDLSTIESELDMKDSHIDELNRQIESCKRDLYSAEEKIHYFEHLSTDDLVEMLRVKGYSVTLSK